MAPKDKRGPKKLLAMGQLTAFMNVYKAACKSYGVTPDKTLLEEAEKKLLICKAIDKVVLRGPHHNSSSLCAVLDAMAGYAPIRNLVCWGCNIGDEGLHVLSQLVRAAAHRTWIGSKPRMIQVISDGAHLPAERWPERYLDLVNGSGGMVTRGSGFQLPSLVVGRTQDITMETIRLQRDPAGEAASLDIVSLERQLSNLMASTSNSTTTELYSQIEKARAAAAGAAGGGAGSSRTVHPADGRPLLRPAKPQAFSSEVLRQFSLALGTQGHMIVILALDHNQLGDLGAKLLAAGIKRCKPLQQLSLSHCGIGPEGATALAAAFRPDPNALLADLQPKLKVLNLGHNPLCAPGLAALAGSLIHMVSLKVLLLADVDVVSEAADLEALSALADCLAANTNIDQVDIDGNHIGDSGAKALLPFLREQKHIRKFRLTPRLSRETLAAVNEAVRANLPKRKKAARKKKPAAKKF
ncbi:hypothetical protein PLESTB_001112800 [Pleodorina starrii]|uniref:Uncharacterized protein n=1 Tax=Pleodorina starrii TaxID=330485 RepID=A0A9W6F4R8_9CHLO|nr:hypothetical protein PLESTM_001349700 [Pleodorina starrii]GLC56488.1 hypothetical protein PLESTB_001112800 [Pleodorina starrii]GLC65937.1 hypothetical protein PLESTF_000363800 [Pleodorina starrii]